MRYFFEFSDQAGQNGDAESIAFATVEEMRREARRTLAQVAGEAAQARDTMELSLRVRDAQGREVYNICLSLKEKAASH